jgi:hypothetical protein
MHPNIVHGVLKELPPSPALTSKFSFCSSVQSSEASFKQDVERSRKPCQAYSNPMVVKTNDDLKRVETRMVSQGNDYAQNSVHAIVHPTLKTHSATASSEASSEYFSLCSSGQDSFKEASGVCLDSVQDNVSLFREEVNKALDSIFIDTSLNLVEPKVNHVSPPKQQPPKVPSPPTLQKKSSSTSNTLPVIPALKESFTPRQSLDAKLSGRKPIRPRNKPVHSQSRNRASLDERKAIKPWR